MGRYDALYQSTPSPTPPAETLARDTTEQPEPIRPHAQPSPTPIESSVRPHRSVEPNDRTAGIPATLLDEISGGERPSRRPTERYSFEIYTDQKPAIEELQYRFRKRTGRKLSSSRIIREAITAYLPEALRALAAQPTAEDEPA